MLHGAPLAEKNPGSNGSAAHGAGGTLLVSQPRLDAGGTEVRVLAGLERGDPEGQVEADYALGAAIELGAFGRNWRGRFLGGRRAGGVAGVRGG